MDSGSWTNVVFTNTLKRLGLSPAPHPRPYKVAWVNITSIQVSQRCQVPIELYSYKDTIWCDVIPMNIGCIILGWSLLYDLDVTLYGRSNTCVFKFKGKKIRPVPKAPKDEPEMKEQINKGKSIKKNKTKALHIIGSKEFKQEIKDEAVVFVVVTKEASSDSSVKHSPEVETILKEFKDGFT